VRISLPRIGPLLVTRPKTTRLLTHRARLTRSLQLTQSLQLTRNQQLTHSLQLTHNQRLTRSQQLAQSPQPMRNQQLTHSLLLTRSLRLVPRVIPRALRRKKLLEARNSFRWKWRLNVLNAGAAQT
jgi:hypothetical protein